MLSSNILIGVDKIMMHELNCFYYTAELNIIYLVMLHSILDFVQPYGVLCMNHVE